MATVAVAGAVPLVVLVLVLVLELVLTAFLLLPLIGYAHAGLLRGRPSAEGGAGTEAEDSRGDLLRRGLLTAVF